MLCSLPKAMLLVSAVAGLASARTPDPLLPSDPNTSPHCTWWLNHDGSQTCADILDFNFIQLADFRRWNPTIGEGCSGLTAGRSYCVEAFGEPPVTGPTQPPTTAGVTTTRPPSTTTTVVVTTTSAGNGIQTPEPVRTDITKTCNRFYLVKAGDTCNTITAAHGITSAQFLAWNPSVGATCSGMWAEYYYCVGIIGGTTQAPPSTTTSAGNGVQTPQPTQPGMVSNCNRFYFVKSGDTCDTISRAHGITVAQVVAWNTGVGSACTGLWANVNVCVGLIGQAQPTTTTRPTTTTSAGNGVTTPQPTQPGMVNNCNRFYFVKSGDTCDTIARAHGITIAQVTTWNTGVGSACTGLWANVNVCVGIIGQTPTTTTRPPATTTTPGNGVTTPQPTQPGMVTNCNRFHFVSPGQTCNDVVSRAGITLAQLLSWNSSIGSTCAGLWANVNVCTGVIRTVRRKRI